MAELQTHSPAGNHPSFYRSMHRMASLPTMHTRALPFSHYDHITPIADASISLSRHSQAGSDEHETEDGSSKARRRIAVACGRCRKRKIRCSGDPGDNSGCVACKTSGDEDSCTFTRVGCHTMEVAPHNIGYLDYEQRPRNHDVLTTMPFDYGLRRDQMIHHRPSLPTLQTALPMFSEDDMHYASSMPQLYGSLSAGPGHRHNSMAFGYGEGDSRRHGGPSSLPPSSQYAYNNMNHGYPMRVASGLVDRQVGMNMGSLGESLPMPLMERRLPIPHVNHYTYTPRAQEHVSHVSWRPHPAGIHDARSSMPWITNAASGRHDSLRSNISCQGATSNTTSQHAQQPVLGYQFSTGGDYSPNVSPMTEPEGVKHYGDVVVPPLASSREQLPDVYYQKATIEPPHSEAGRHHAAMYEAGMHLFTFGTGLSDSQHVGVGASRIEDITSCESVEQGQVQTPQESRYSLTEPARKHSVPNAQQQRARISVPNLKAAC